MEAVVNDEENNKVKMEFDSKFREYAEKAINFKHPRK